MLDADQTRRARARLQDLETELVVLLDPGSDPDDGFARALCFLLESLVDLARNKLRLEHVEGGPLGRPSFRVKNVTYLAAPLERELDPFLDLLVLLSRGAPRPAPPRAIEPARIELLIAPSCPNCPAVVRACAEVAATLPQVELVVIDAQRFTDLAGSCRSVPTLIIDGTRTVVGLLGAAELIELLLERDREGYLARALGSMIEAGRLPEAVPLITTDEGYAAMATLMRDGSMQQKMGLLLTVEQALERTPHALDSALPFLLPLLESDDVTLRGDVADLVGRIGAPAARDALTALLSDDNPDVREIAAEALGTLRAPS